MFNKIISFIFKSIQRNQSNAKQEPEAQSVVDFFFPNGLTLALPQGCEESLRERMRKIEAGARHGTGMYYELYEPRVLRGFRDLEASLFGYEKEVFKDILAEEDWDISDEAYSISRSMEAEVWREIHQEYDCDC